MFFKETAESEELPFCEAIELYFDIFNVIFNGPT